MMHACLQTSGIGRTPDRYYRTMMQKRKASEFTESGGAGARRAPFIAGVLTYDRELRFGSEDPADPAVARRVLIIMLASKY